MFSAIIHNHHFISTHCNYIIPSYANNHFHNYLTATAKITFTSQNSYFLLLHIKFYEKQFMARNDPFEADLHGLEPEKLVLLMRSLNERAMGLNEEGKTKWWPKRVLVPWKLSCGSSSSSR